MGRKKHRPGLEAVALRAFREAQRPLTRNELLKALGLRKHERGQLFEMLGRLLSEGAIIQLGRDGFGLVENLKLLTGRLEVQRSGVGFVLCDDRRRKDIFINPANMGEAWNGDRVAVAVLPGRGSRVEGRIARVIERRLQRMPVRVARVMGRYCLCQPMDPKLPFSVMTDMKPLSGAVHGGPKPGDVLLAAPGEQLDSALWSATALEWLGSEDNVAVQEAAVKIGKGIPGVFPADALEEARGLPAQPSEEDFAGRQDLRAIAFVTIDGAQAKDFDDAIHVEELHDGFRLRVAIADVAHYVRPGSALDREARTRGNSYYFPLSVEPMFPEQLSNGLCSLNPRTPRLVMVADLVFSASGVPRPERTAFCEAVICSQARLTYGQVKRALLEGDAAEREAIAPVMPMLERAEALARQLHARRLERGTLDFDLPEPEILFNVHGETMDIRPKARHFGHQLIEEFMIAANEAVAEHLTRLGLPCLYRMHAAPDPDKLAGLFRLLGQTALGSALQQPIAQVPAYKIGVEDAGLRLQQLLVAATGTDQEYLVSRLALRSMMQAAYSPENEGHFGLASRCYCHFTSPIRRYADLVVHRVLKLALRGHAAEDKALRPKSLKNLAERLGLCERLGMDAEREILKRVTVLFLRNRVDEIFDGVVSGVADFGFWVELKEFMAEGLIRLSTLHDDYYTLIPERHELRGSRTGRRIQLGDTFQVRLLEVNLSRLEINLGLVSPPREEPSRTRPAKRIKGRRAGTQSKKIFLDDTSVTVGHGPQASGRQSGEKRRGKRRSDRKREGA